MSRDAEFYQGHKDDPGIWETASAPMNSPRKRLDSMVSVRFSPEEEATLRAEAKRQGVSLSKLVRAAALATVSRTSFAHTETAATRALRSVGGSNLIDARPIETGWSNSIAASAD